MNDSSTRTIKVCQICDSNTPANSKLGKWMTGVRQFWDRNKILDVLFDNGYVILLVASLLFNYVEELQPYAAVPFMGFIVVYGLGEYVPINKMPFSTRNAVLDSGSKYVGAMAVVTHLLFVTLFFSLVMELFQPSTPELLIKRTISVLAIVIPIVASFYILVADH